MGLSISPRSTLALPTPPKPDHATDHHPRSEYAQVVKMLGNGRLEALCFDGEKRLAHIRGKLRKKVWINQGDIILLSLRDYQDEKGDVILKYSADEARSLKAYGELPESAKINETDTYVPFAALFLSFLFSSMSPFVSREISPSCCVCVNG